MAERRAEVSRADKMRPPRRVGQPPRGPSSTPSDEEGFTLRCWTDAKGSGVRIFSKNVSEQFQPVNRRQLANTCQHVLEFERLREKAVGACGETLAAHFGRAV
jgi:hypothetical protein